MNANETLIAGDTLDFTVTVADYPANAGWTLKYQLTPRFTAPTQAAIVLTASTNVNGVDYNVQSAPATTAAWKPGLYTWARWVEKTGARQTLDESGELLIKPDPNTMVQGYDARSQAQKAVEDLLTIKANFQTTGRLMESYTIGSRSVTFKNSADLEKELRFWQRELMNEQSAAAAARGLPNPRRTYIRFGARD